MKELKKLIRDVPDFPKKGIIFKDITTLIKDKNGFKRSIDLLKENIKHLNFEKFVAIESRGYIFGAALAYLMNKGLVIVRKPGKLPAETIREEYSLEYGKNIIEIHKDAIDEGEKVIIIDDLLATGGTALATARLVERLGGKVAGMLFLIELDFLKGREKLKGYDIFSIIHY